jgi:hypothetical protein
MIAMTLNFCLTLTLTLTLQEVETLYEEERRAADDLRNQLAVSERKRVQIAQELEDARSLLEAVSACLPACCR